MPKGQSAFHKHSTKTSTPIFKTRTPNKERCCCCLKHFSLTDRIVKEQRPTGSNGDVEDWYYCESCALTQITICTEVPDAIIRSSDIVSLSAICGSFSVLMSTLSLQHAAYTCRA